MTANQKKEKKVMGSDDVATEEEAAAYGAEVSYNTMQYDTI
jgi:hypothetical protein